MPKAPSTALSRPSDQAPSVGTATGPAGVPAGVIPDMAFIQAFMDRRAPGRNAMSTARRETDVPQIIAGLNERGETCGAPLCAVFRNTDTRPQDYDKMRFKPRPSHADYPVFVKTNGANDARGGGHTSTRLTAPRIPPS